MPHLAAGGFSSPIPAGTNDGSHAQDAWLGSGRPGGLMGAPFSAAALRRIPHRLSVEDMLVGSELQFSGAMSPAPAPMCSPPESRRQAGQQGAQALQAGNIPWRIALAYRL